MENDENFINLYRYSSISTKIKIKKFFEEFVLYIASKEKKFAEKCDIENGELKSFVFNERNEEVYMCQGIKIGRASCRERV